MKDNLVKNVEEILNKRENERKKIHTKIFEDFISLAIYFVPWTVLLFVNVMFMKGITGSTMLSHNFKILCLVLEMMTITIFYYLSDISYYKSKELELMKKHMERE